MTKSASVKPARDAKQRFCTECGTRLLDDAVFCHECGASVGGGPRSAPPVVHGTPNPLRWGVPLLAIVALLLLTVFQARSGSSSGEPQGATPLGQRAMQAPDISTMSLEEQANRLFNRVMRLSSEGKADSAAFFGSMAMGAIEALGPLDAHRRYDLGLVALVMGDAGRARAQADTILSQNRNHLLGLSLAARAADARNDAMAATAFRRRLLAAESAERAKALPEYTDHDADIRAAIELARKG